DLAVAGVPKPVPVIRVQILVERLQRGGAEPEAEIEIAGRRGNRLIADARAALSRLAGAATADQELAIFAGMHGGDRAGKVQATAALGAMLDDPVVFFGGFDALAAFD